MQSQELKAVNAWDSLSVEKNSWAWCFCACGVLQTIAAHLPTFTVSPLCFAYPDSLSIRVSSLKAVVLKSVRSSE
jgi:hypothetical protein